MKKKAFYILLGMVLMFGFNTKVKADGSCRCYYGTDAFGIVVNVTDSGVPDVTKSGTQSTYINLSTNNLSVTNFNVQARFIIQLLVVVEVLHIVI